MPVGDWGAYEKFVTDLMAESQLPGVAVAVAQDGETVYADGFGYRNQAEQLPITTKTALGIGSVTKSFTSLGIMLLVEDKKTRWLPEFRIAGKEAANRMTLHHLLTHTSGMPPLPTVQVALARSLRDDPDLRDTPQYAELQKLEPVDTVEELIEYVNGLDVTLLGYPGVYSSYSNEGFALLGLVIERASGKPYEQFMQERVLDPLGMIHTTPGVACQRLRFSTNGVGTKFTVRTTGGRPLHTMRRAVTWYRTPTRCLNTWTSTVPAGLDLMVPA